MNQIPFSIKHEVLWEPNSFAQWLFSPYRDNWRYDKVENEKKESK